MIARHFSSSKQFAIPSPKPVSSNQSIYHPPTIISVAPTDDWLFAYFPKSNGEGTGCLWKRGPQIDNWVVQEWWTFPPQTAPIAADWLGAPREVSIRDSPFHAVSDSCSVGCEQFWQTRAIATQGLYLTDIWSILDPRYTGLPHLHLLLSILPAEPADIEVSIGLGKHVSTRPTSG